MGQVNELKDFTWGQLIAALMKIGQDAGMDTAQGIRAFLAGELVVSAPARLWREQDGIIYFSVTSNGMTGKKWIRRLEKKGFRVGNYAKSVLLSSDFKPTSGVTYHIVVLKGKLWKDSDRITSNIRAEAEKRKFEKPNAEVACLIREKFTDAEIEAMGLWWIVAMHEPIKDSDGGLSLLSASRGGDGQWLGTACSRPGRRWNDDDGFAFVAPQVSTQDSATEK